MPVTEIPVKSALRKGLLPDVFTSSLYACATSRGCRHGCLYCDGRAEKYYVEGNFAADIGVRTELPDLLEKELPRLRERDFRGRRSMISLGSGVTDVYQGADLVRQTTRRCAEVFAENDSPVLVMTKSSAILNDVDLWSKVVARGGFLLLMTIAQGDEALRRRFEPGASPLESRWETLQAFRERGASVGVLAMPLLPGVSDDEKTLRSLYERASQIGVDYLMAGGLTLRPGRQKDLFLAAIRALYPGLTPFYQELYRENRPSGAPIRRGQDELSRRISSVAQDYALPSLWPHRMYSQRLPRYESVFLLLQQMEESYRERTGDLGRLRLARDRFALWLTEKRTAFRRHRTLEDTWIDGEFQTLLEPGALESLLANDRLAAFVRRVVAGSTFDPLLRKLVDPEP